MSNSTRLDGPVSPVDPNMPMPAQDSLAKRSVYKFISNVVGLISNIIIQAIVPRALGPRAFGDFNFLTSFFGQVTEFLDGRSSVGALVKVSLRPNEPGLIVFYIYYAFAATLFVFAGVWGFIAAGWADNLWPYQSVTFIVFSACWALLAWYHGILHKICDAFGFTVEAERARIAQKILSIVLILAMVFTEKVTLTTFFIYYLVVLAFLVVGFAQIIIRNGKWPALSEWLMPWHSVRRYAREYYEFSLPLLSYIAVESAVAVFDRWMLQNHSGSVEQGYFGLAYQIGYVSILFVVAMSPLIEREFSVSFAEEDKERINYLFHRYMPILFAIASFFGAFVCVQADSFVALFAGDQYSESTSVISILAFYPIYYTFGRVLGSVFFATGQNKPFRNIGLSVQVLGIGLTWLFVAPAEYGGLAMGADGLAIKLVIVYALLVNIQLVHITNVLQLGFRSIFVQQHLSLAAFLLLAIFAQWVVNLNFSDQSVLAQFLAGGVCYVLVVALVTLFIPYFSGLKHKDILNAVQYLRKFKEAGLTVDLPTDNYRTLDSRLKIAILGAANSIHTRRWVNSLAERGHSIHLISLHPCVGHYDNSVTFHRLKFSAPWGYVLNWFKLRSILRAINPDLLHVHYASGYGTLGTLSGFSPRIVSVWGQDIFNFPYESIYSRLTILLNLRTATWVCSTSKMMAEQTVRVLPVIAGRISVTPFGVDSEVFAPGPPPRDQVVVGTVKTLLHKYGIDTLIKGFAIARDRVLQLKPDLGQKMVLRIVGGGDWQPQLEFLAEKCGIQSVTKFVGPVEHEHVADELRKLNIYVAMSREESESFGVAVVEASSCGLPVIVSDIGGLREVVLDQKTGILVPQERYEILADQLVRLVLDPERGVALGQNGRAHVLERYEWSKSLDIMEGVYAMVTSRYKRS